MRKPIIRPMSSRLRLGKGSNASGQKQLMRLVGRARIVNGQRQPCGWAEAKALSNSKFGRFHLNDGKEKDHSVIEMQKYMLNTCVYEIR